uniref:Integrase catalytic domain-containing protein n=1 Tax=Panagrolaimus sp. JU765 TaxID=591449 RepID=A0AC34RR48_9BILA
MGIDEKIKILDKANRCRRCFRRGHATTECRSNKLCQNCKKEHNTALCPEKESKKVSAHSISIQINLSSTAEQFTESTKDHPYLTRDDEIIQEFLENTKIVDGRLQVKFPLTMDNPPVPLNKNLAFCCLKAQLDKLKQNQQLLNEVNEMIHGQLRQGIIETVEFTDKIDCTSYMPFLLVLTENKTTNIRMVFNASAKCGKKKLSLNDFMEAGPSMIPDLLGLLLRIRALCPILTVADVEKAFHQLRLHPDHRDFTRFLWIKDMAKYMKNGLQSNNIWELRFTSVPFGCKASPFLLNASNQLLFNQLEDTELAQNLKADTYVDNITIRSDSPETAIQKMQTTIQLFASVGMNLRGVVSNNDEVLEYFKSSFKIISLLGYTWNPQDDTLAITYQPEPLTKFTKRTVLAAIGQVYDPIGLMAPVIIKFRLFMRIIKDNVWDQKLNDDLIEQWKSMENQCWARQWIRHIGSPYKNSTTELHVFCDASNMAYAAVAYLVHRNMDTNESVSNFLMAKTKLAPTKTVTTPRIELLAATLGAKVITFIMEALPALKDSKCILWTDSSAVFHWITSEKLLKHGFVQNRVNEIRNANAIIRHVPTDMNPADIASRGCTSSELEQHPLWFKGPSWLIKSETEWPLKFSLTTPTPDVQKEMICATTATISSTPMIYSEDRPSKWLKFLRVQALVLKFIKKCRKQPTSLNIDADDMIEAERVAITSIQKQYPPTPKQMVDWQLFTDEFGILRRQSRFGNLDATDLVYPIFLPHCRATTLLIQHIHSSKLHANARITVAELRQRFWIPKAISTVKKSIKACFGCLRFRVKPYQLPLMAPLPLERLQRGRPFANIGLDGAGPFTIKNGEDQKRWVLLFTCLATRAVHMEIVPSLSAEACINAFRRFTAHYGTPTSVLTDHGTNFVATAPIVQKWAELVRDETLLLYASNQKIKWSFITERSPWKGGVYERLIGLFKNCIKYGICRRKLTEDNFLTLIKEAQGILNTRPLGVDVDDEPIRPIDFLLPQAQLGIPPINDIDADPEDPEYLPNPTFRDNLVRNLAKTTICLDKIWQRWNHGYLTDLRDTAATLHRQHGLDLEPKVNDVVLIEEEEVPRGSWKLGKITSVQKSKDGHIRETTVLTKNGTLHRSPAHLYPLEANVEPCVTNVKINYLTYFLVIITILLTTTNGLPQQQFTCNNGTIQIYPQNFTKVYLRWNSRAKVINVNNNDPFTINLPRQLAFRGGPVQITAYSGDNEEFWTELYCPALNYCSSMDFRSLEFFWNLHCWPLWMWCGIAAEASFVVAALVRHAFSTERMLSSITPMNYKSSDVQRGNLTALSR